jgi:hypothetical protein
MSARSVSNAREGDEVSNIDWRAVLVRYMAHVGESEGVFFDDSFTTYPECTQEEWEKVVEDATALCGNGG